MQKKINHVLVVSSSYPISNDGSGAAGTFVHDFALELRNFVKVTILAPSTDNSIEKIENLTVSRFKVPKLPLSHLNIQNPLHLFYSLLTIKSGLSSINNLVNHKDIDHILALWVLPCGLWAYLVNKKLGIPYSCWALGSDIWSYNNNCVTKKLLKILLGSSKINFADGIKLKKDVIAICKNKCSFLPSSRILPEPEIDKSKLKDNRLRLAFLGRWHHNKGIDILFDALEKIGNKDWDKIIEVRVAGGGPLENKVKKACNKLLSHKRPISLFSYLNKQEASNLFNWADYVLIPSRKESIPVIFSDALQSNTPVIATPAGDLSDLIYKYQVGIVSKYINSSSYSDAIKLALNTNPNLYKNYISIAYDNFNLHKSAEIFINSISKNNV